MPYLPDGASLDFNDDRGYRFSSLPELDSGAVDSFTHDDYNEDDA